MTAPGGSRRFKLAPAVVAGVALGLWPVSTLRASTGEVVTTVNVGSAVPAADEHNVSQPLTGMAIGLAHLVVPGTNRLTVYGN
jgi:hypothetical protein